MASAPRCVALAAAKEKKGLSYAQIASQIGSNEQHVTDICAGKKHPTEAEFKALVQVLDIKNPAPAMRVHSTLKLDLQCYK